MLGSSGPTGYRLATWAGVAALGWATLAGCGSQEDVADPAASVSASVPADVSSEDLFPQVEYEFVPFNSAAELLKLPGIYVVRGKPAGAVKQAEARPDRPEGLPGSETPAFLLTESSRLVVSEVVMVPDKDEDPFASEGTAAPRPGEVILAGADVINSAARDLGDTNLEEAGHPEEGDVFGWGEALYG